MPRFTLYNRYSDPVSFSSDVARVPLVDGLVGIQSGRLHRHRRGTESVVIT
jgi:hypothetical protein